MGDYYEHEGYGGGKYRPVSGTTVLCASLAGVAIGGPLLGMMGFSFLASVTLLIVASPLLLLSSPLLLAAGFLFAGVLIGFAVAAVMALTALSTLGWITREIRERFGYGGFGFGKLKERSRDWPDYYYKVTNTGVAPNQVTA
ncbi:hypothetical protein L6164_030944 [Bauhinia variegata]|uniref:Uncharacterized protein n=1 Tax=Bauhinia variegata TaxID=167791 RepID=A0ACB9LEA2_BAUVA|nr:hypothetical protein L6164_030944 [Bauhinia variegata]